MLAAAAAEKQLHAKTLDIDRRKDEWEASKARAVYAQSLWNLPNDGWALYGQIKVRPRRGSGGLRHFCTA